MMRTYALGAFACAAAAAAAAGPYSVPMVPLRNAASPGLVIPAMGLGTGGYSSSASGGWGSYPECWNEWAGCGPWVTNATVQYLQMATSSGQMARIDHADTYADLIAVGKGIQQSGVDRSKIFLLSKIGSSMAMGYADTAAQVQLVLANNSVTYVDSILIHWPTSSAPSQEPACNPGAAFNATFCRLETWRALVDAWKAGTVRSIGVSNYNVSELQEIEAAGMPLPAINQIPIHLYRSSTQMETIVYCTSKGILVNAYSPLGVPDWHVFPVSAGMSPTPLEDPVVVALAQKHGRSPAAITIAWLWSYGIITNPRTVQPAHMDDNLRAYDIALTDVEVNLLTTRPQSWCSVDEWYECAPDALAPAAPHHPWTRA